MAIAQELGYEKTGGGKSPTHLQTIAVLVSDVLNLTLSQLVKGIQEVLRTEGYSMLLFEGEGEADHELEFLRDLSAENVSGVILSGPNVGVDYAVTLQQQQIPFVVALSYATDQHVPCVSINNVEAAFEVIDTLYRYGHRSIAIITGPVGDLTVNRDRLLGCRLAAKGKGLVLDEDLIIEGDYSFDSGYEAAKSILEHRTRPTAVFAFGDMMALGAIRCFEEAGLKIPEDISIIGFDGTELTRCLYPELATVRQPSLEIGREAASLLIEILSKEDAEIVIKREMDYELLQNSSLKDIADVDDIYSKRGDVS